jgi:hypothetical protein
LRFIGLMNAAVWFGASLFFMLGVAPAFFTPRITDHLGRPWAGFIAFIVFERYFALQYWCGAIALAHHLAEWVYLGRPLQRATMLIVLGVFGLGLFGGLWLQPRLERQHAIKYAKPGLYNDEQKAAAEKSLSAWHVVSRITGLLSLVGLAIYVWRMGNPPNPPRFMPATKFRS